MGLLLPPFQATDNAGNPLASARLATFVTGTTTDKANYTNDLLTAAGANPVISDANGWFPAVYGLEDERYTLRLRNSADDTTYWTINSYGGASVPILDRTRRRSLLTSPMDYAAVADGSTNDATALADAITASTSVIDLEGRTYKCNATLDIPSGRIIQNGVLDFTDNVSDECIRFRGTESAATTLSSSAAAGDTTIAVTSATGLAVGDMLRLYDDINGTEIVFISAISGTTLTLKGEVRLAHTTGNNAAVREITPVRRSGMINIRVIGDSGRTYRGAYLEDCEQVLIDNCRFDSMDRAINVYRSASAVIRDCVVERGTLANSSAGGYGVWTQDCRDVITTGLLHTGGYITTTGSGNVWGIMFAQCHSLGVWQFCAAVQHDFSAIDCTATLISSSTELYAFDGLNCNFRLYGCRVLDGPTGGIRYRKSNALDSDCQIVDCWVDCVDDACNVAISSTGLIDKLHIRGGRYLSTSGNGITFTTSASVQGIDISGAHIRTNSATATEYVLEIEGTGSAVITGVSVSGCYLLRNADEGVNTILTGAVANGILGASFTGCAFNNGTYGITHTNSTDVAVNACYFTGQATADLGGVFKVDGLYMTSVAITATEIVGSAVGDIGSTNGVALVTAVAGKVILIDGVSINYTFATAAYTGGSAISARYQGGEDATGTTTEVESIGAAANNIQLLRPLAGAALVNTNVVLICTTPFTQPGTAAGTAVIRTFYRLVQVAAL